jgi:putative transposase
MPDYRRAYVPGGTFFFTVTTFERQPILTGEPCRAALRLAINEVRKRFPFQSIAWVLLPDHLHTIWKLPDMDTDFSLRWSLIKQRVTQQCTDNAGDLAITLSRQRRRERTVWQRRFWEHFIRDDIDFQNHIDYIHYNPVKHGYVTRPSDWPYSTFHQFVRNGVYPADWACVDENTPSHFGE